MSLRAVLIAVCVLFGAAAALIAFAPQLVFVPADAAHLYRTSGDDLNNAVSRLEQSGAGRCERADAPNSVRYRHPTRSVSCEVIGLAGRRATVRFLYIECSAASARLLRVRLDALFVDESKVYDVPHWPCPGDDISSFVIE